MKDHSQYAIGQRALHPMINDPGDICLLQRCHGTPASATIGLSHIPKGEGHLIFRFDLVVSWDGEISGATNVM